MGDDGADALGRRGLLAANDDDDNDDAEQAAPARERDTFGSAATAATPAATASATQRASRRPPSSASSSLLPSHTASYAAAPAESYDHDHDPSHPDDHAHDPTHTHRSLANGATADTHPHQHSHSIFASHNLSRVLLLAAVMAALGGFLFGYDVGIISGALLQLEDEFGLTAIQQELVVSVMLLGAMLASVVGGFLVDLFGRRDTIVINAVVFIIGALVLATAKDYGVLLFGRLVVGFGVSLSAIAEVIYISEIAPPATRGFLVSLNEMGITLGILIAYTINYAFISTPRGWRYMFGLSAIPAAIQGVGMLFLPKSPRWLVLKERPYDALKALRILRGSNGSRNEAEMQSELSRIERSLQEQARISVKDLITQPVLRRCLLVACGLALLQQFTGQPNVLYYGSTLFKAAGFKTDRQATLANMLIGVAKVIATIIALAKIDKAGRRALLLVGVSIMVVSLGTLAAVTQAYPPTEVVVNATSLPASSTTSASLIPVAATTTTSSLTDAEGVRRGVVWIPASEVDIASCCAPNVEVSLLAWSLISPASFRSANCSCTMETSQDTLRRRRDSDPDADPVGEGSPATKKEVVFENSAVKWTSMVCMVVFVVAYAFSFGPVTWLLLSELFPDDIRGRAMSWATIFNWGGNLLVSLTFLSLLGKFTRCQKRENGDGHGVADTPICLLFSSFRC